MSEPFLERLSRFTPDVGGLDRDALLYAAGRASARPNRSWIALTVALALAQPLYLVLLWPHLVLPTSHQPVAGVSSPAPTAPPPVSESLASDSLESPGLWSIRHNLSEAEAEDSAVPARAVTFIESGPPLRAFAPPPPSILN